MAGDVVVKIDADTSAYIAKLAKLAEAQQKLGTAANPGLSASKMLAEETAQHMERQAAALTKVAAGLSAVAGIAAGFADSMNRANKTAGQLSAPYGGNTVRATTALRNIGFSGKDATAVANSLLTSTSAASADERIGFAESLAGYNNSFSGPAAAQLRAAFGINEQTFSIASGAFAQYGAEVFGPGGSRLIGYLSDPVNSRDPVRLRAFIDAEVKRAGPRDTASDASKELGAQAQVNNINLQTQQDTAQEGRQQRVGQALTERAELTRRTLGAVREAFEKGIAGIPIIGGALGAASRAITETRQREEASRRAAELLGDSPAQDDSIITGGHLRAVRERERRERETRKILRPDSLNIVH